MKEIDVKNDNNEFLIQKNIKQKKWIIFLSSIIILGILFMVGLFYIYINKDSIIRKKLVQTIKEYKNEEKINMSNRDLPFVEKYHNANNKLDLFSSYNDNHPTHPKVIYFDEPWNDYKYWMVFSPYPYSDDSKENPHLKVSNDLINWTEPNGLKNPIEDTPKDYENMVIYYSDPHILYNEDNDCLEIYFRRVDDKKDEMIIYRSTSQNGVEWTEKEIVFKTVRSKEDFVSPAFIYEDHKYKVWYVDKGNTIKYAESDDGYKYTKKREIKIEYPLSYLKTWHLDVIHTEYGYEMIMVAYTSWEDRNSMNLYYSKSKDNKNWSDAIIIIKPSLISWDNKGIYRSTFIKLEDTYYVFYSGISTSYERGIGLSYGKNIENLIGANINKKIKEKK